jgi:hypothetical protein
MKNFVPVAVVVVVVVALAGVAIYRAKQPSAKETASHAVIIRDRSDSATAGCAAIGGLAREYLQAGHADRFSSIIALATGDARSNDEPVEFARLTGVRKASVKDIHKARDRREDALVEELVRRCEEQGNTDRSPIYLALRRGLEELVVLGCHEGTNCAVYLQSDMAENGESGLRKALLGIKDAVLPSPIDNRGIRVHVCGIAETSGPIDGKGKVVSERKARGAKRADVTPNVWRRIFTAPNLVTFEPHCPKAEPNTDGDHSSKTVVTR